METRRIARLGLAAALFALALPAVVRSQPAGGPGVKLPVPGEAHQAEALALVRDVYREQFDQARTAPGRVVLARMLLKQAAVTTEAAAGRFVLMDLAREIATEAGDLELSLRAIDDLATIFAIDRLAMTDRTLDQIARRTQTSQQSVVAAQVATGLADEAIADDRCQLARHLGQTALAAARKAGDTMLVKQVVAKNQKVEQAARDYRVVQQALAVLAETPADVEANLAVGKHDCFIKGDWEKGLRKLALTDDPTLGPLAEMELKAPLSTDEQLELADRWFAPAGDEENRDRRSFQARAAFWYQSALPNLSGLMKLRAEKRLEQLADAMTATVVEASPAPGQENRSVRLPMTAEIDGSDTLQVFATHAIWTHGDRGWPQSLVFGGVAWSPRRMPVMPFTAATKRRLSRVDFRSAGLVRIRGRNDVRLENAGDHVTIRFHDSDPGAGVYEVVVDLPWKTE
jgi:hypothetical protein